MRIEDKEGKDRISSYLIAANQSIIFDELKDSYLEKAGLLDVLHEVPVPLLFDEEGMSTLTLAYGMARIVGGDRGFPHAGAYLEYIKLVFGDKAARALVSEGARMAGDGDYLTACMMLRTALTLEPRDCDALYLYARACKDEYERASEDDEDEEYVGMFKAESLESFELLTMLHPGFAMGYYFLGYGYLNLGLYTKAQLTWQEFMKLAESEADNTDTDVIAEIEERLAMLDEPVQIENGCNLIMGGSYQGGLEILKRFTSGRYENWWPLWYHIGVARTALNDAEGAIEAYKKVLVLSPSNTDVMKELADVYDALGDTVNREKYLKKIEVVKSYS